MKSTSQKSDQVSTSNMAEVVYLLTACRHKITSVEPKTSWPYGVEELCVTLEGENIEADHWTYLKHGHCNLEQLPKAFDSIMSVLRDAQAVGGEL